MSATRLERILLVTGMILGFVGLALGLAHGGFS
jgi:ABC-type lipoprotein release transport system permease subunit